MVSWSRLDKTTNQTLDLAYNFEIQTSCMFVHFVLILESSCSFRLKHRWLVLSVIVALACNMVGFHGDDCQVSPVRSLKALFGSQSLPFPVVTISLVTRQHNIQPYCWNCAMTPRTRCGHVILFVGGSSDLLIVEYVYNLLVMPFCLHAGNVVTWCHSGLCCSSAGLEGCGVNIRSWA
jgi:hypothetical protein